MYGDSGPSLGLFSDEAGGFLGGHGMNDDNKLQMGAGLSDLWDGKAISRVRVGDGASVLPGRRLASHLMVQPGIADRLLSNVELTQQGLLSRILVASPRTLAGTRMQRTADPDSKVALAAYRDRLGAMLAAKVPMHDGGLQPRRLELDSRAAGIWSAFTDEIERALGPGGPLEPIRGFANKIPEHAARIAGVLGLVADGEAELIGHQSIEQGIALARFYASEALRLFHTGAIPPAVAQAEMLLRWLHREWGESIVGIGHVYQRGPMSIRTKGPARAAIRILEEHGWLVAIEGGAAIDGKRHRDAWRVVPSLSQLSQLSQGSV